MGLRKPFSFWYAKFLHKVIKRPWRFFRPLSLRRDWAASLLRRVPQPHWKQNASWNAAFNAHLSQLVDFHDGSCSFKQTPMPILRDNVLRREGHITVESPRHQPNGSESNPPGKYWPENVQKVVLPSLGAIAWVVMDAGWSLWFCKLQWLGDPQSEHWKNFAYLCPEAGSVLPLLYSDNPGSLRGLSQRSGANQFFGVLLKSFKFRSSRQDAISGEKKKSCAQELRRSMGLLRSGTSGNAAAGSLMYMIGLLA